MPRFEPFAGLRYDPGALATRGATLDDVVAPPYDVIDPAEREALAARSPWNAVRVELPVEDPGTGRDPYQVAAALLASWREEGVLAGDEDPSFYGYRMSFTDSAGRPRRTVGVIGALEVSPPGQGDVLPHERTMPKPKSDRLDLLRACQANLSPVWGLSLASGLGQLVEASLAVAGGQVDRALDGEGVVHELWPITHAGTRAAVAAAVASAPVVIADGHHRYETALAYGQERRVANAGRPGDYDLVMALVVELAEDQLAVGPIHRLVEDLPAGFDLAGALSAYFELLLADPLDPVPNGSLGRFGRAPGSAGGPFGGGDGPVGEGRPGGDGGVWTGLGDVLEAGGGPALVTAKAIWHMEARPETVARAGEDLDSSRLSLALEGLPHHHVSYHHDPAQVMAAVAAGRADAGILVRPAPVAVIAEVARSRRRMPPKSTFFAPKPRTGMVLRGVAG